GVGQIPQRAFADREHLGGLLRFQQQDGERLDEPLILLSADGIGCGSAHRLPPSSMSPRRPARSRAWFWRICSPVGISRAKARYTASTSAWGIVGAAMSVTNQVSESAVPVM